MLASYPIGNATEPVTIMRDTFVASVKAVSQDTFNGSEFSVPRCVMHVPSNANLTTFCEDAVNWLLSKIVLQ